MDWICWNVRLAESTSWIQSCKKRQISKIYGQHLSQTFWCKNYGGICVLWLTFCNSVWLRICVHIWPEMQKVTDVEDISVLFFPRQCWCDRILLYLFLAKHLSYIMQYIYQHNRSFELQRKSCRIRSQWAIYMGKMPLVPNLLPSLMYHDIN